MMRTTIIALSVAALVQVSPSIAAEVSRSSGLTEITEALDGVGSAEAAFIRRSKIRKKRTSGYRMVTVVGDDEAGEVTTVDVSILHMEGQPIPLGGVTSCDTGGVCNTTMTLALKVVRPRGGKRFVFKDLDFSEDPADFNFVVTTAMKDALGQQVGTELTSIIGVEEEGDSRVRSVTVRQLDETNFRVKVVVVGDIDDEIEKIFFSFDDYSGPDPEPDDSFTLESPTIKSNGNKVFKINTLTFSVPDVAADEVYSVIIDLRGFDGNTLGSSYHQVVVEGLE